MLETIRNFLNDNRMACIVVGCLISLTLVYWMLTTLFSGISGDEEGRRPQIDTVWFYDLEAKTLFEGPRDQLPPIPVPGKSGTNGVRAYLFSCTDNCADDKFIGYLEQYTPEAKPLYENQPSNMTKEHIKIMHSGRKVRSESGEKWYPFASAPGQKITILDMREKCGGKDPMTQCYPVNDKPVEGKPAKE